MRTIIPFFCNLAEQITQFVAYRLFLLLQLNAAILSLEADERRGVGIYDLPLSSSLTMQLSAGVQNIFNAYQTDFDQGWNRDSNYIYGPSQPRSVFLGVKMMY